jgi:hypothetical protein
LVQSWLLLKQFKSVKRGNYDGLKIILIEAEEVLGCLKKIKEHL